MRWAEVVRQGRVFSPDRVFGYCVVLLAFELACFAFFVAGTHGWIVPLDQPNASDFVSFYGAGRLTNEGTPALAYDHAAHHLREQQATEFGIPYNFFYYPPVFLFLCAALARLPYLAAFCTFQTTCLLPCLALIHRIVGPVPLTTLLAFPAVFWAVGTGQNALLTAALLAAATLNVDGRPVLAGIMMGALCYKPHLGLLLPVALAAGGHWRAFAAAAASASTLIAASLLAFGWGTWHAFFAATTGATAVYGTAETSIDLAGLTNPYGLILALGGAPALAMQVQGVVTLAVALTVAWVWAGQSSLAVRAAVLVAAIPVAAPFIMFYDLMLAGLAIAWLVRDGRDHDFPPWQQAGLAVAFVLPLLSGNTGFSSQIAIPPASAALVLVLALRQAYWRSAFHSLRWLPE